MKQYGITFKKLKFAKKIEKFVNVFIFLKMVELTINHNGKYLIKLNYQMLKHR